MSRRIVAAVGLICAISPRAALAQDESRIGAEFRLEADKLREDCRDIKKLTSCAMTVATGHPLHLAFGSISPGNGLAFGAAFGTSHAPSESWRMTWSGDAVRTFGGSWRAGAYVKLIHTPSDVISVVTSPSDTPAPGSLAVRPHAVIGLFAQTTSLQRVSYYGLGPDTARDHHSVFGLTETVAGGNAIAPIASAGSLRRLNLAAIGEATGRFIALRDGRHDQVPTTGALFTDSTAPGLANQPAFLQLGEGLRLAPVLAGDRLRLSYLLLAQQFIAGSSSTSSFRRYRLDLRHEIPIYGHSGGGQARDINSPNDCATTAGEARCPAVSRDRYGSVSVRALMVTSSTSPGHSVPFYFQPTLGGADINGQPSLASYDDARFRAPHLLLLQQTFEMSVWGPIGAWVQADQGTVALARRDLSSGFKRSLSIGTTLRAGGFPMMTLSYATGGPEGHHITATVSTSLLGGSARPGLD